MSFEFFVGVIIGLAILMHLVGEVYDYVQVKRGVFPRKADTTIEDIKKLRDSGFKGTAISRFRQLPENKRIYTEYGAAKKVEEL